MERTLMYVSCIFFCHCCSRTVEDQESVVKWTSCQHGSCLLQLYPFSVSSGVRESNVTVELSLQSLWPFQVQSVSRPFSWAGNHRRLKWMTPHRFRGACAAHVNQLNQPAQSSYLSLNLILWNACLRHQVYCSINGLTVASTCVAPFTFVFSASEQIHTSAS